jgi:CDP-glycerol glycerophosphotransferase
LFKYFNKIIVKIFLVVFYIFPVNKRKIIFSSFNGKRFFCNPKYIFNDIYGKFINMKYVWCLNQYNPEMSEYKDTIIVKTNTLVWTYHMMTSKVIIVNTHLPSFLPYRNDQIIINTWHGGGSYKNVGISEYSSSVDINWGNRDFRRMLILSSKNVTYFISSSKVFSEIMHKHLYIADNKFLPIGMPRNDILFKNGNICANKIKEGLNIPVDTGIVIYAPTFRGSHSQSETQIIIKLNVQKIITTLKNRNKKEFVFLFKGHPSFPNNLVCNEAMDISSYSDLQELLLIADVLITDYSSSIWDFSLMFKPCFLFAPDLDQYLTHDRGFYTPIAEWPFPLAKTNEELCNNIMNFNQEEYNAKVKKHHEDLGSYEQGTATEKVTELLQEIYK